MADKQPDMTEHKSRQAPEQSAIGESGKSAADPFSGAEPENPKQQRVSGILRAVLDEEIPAEADGGKRMRYPWFIDVILGLGLLVAVGGFFLGLFKMYITHKAQQCIIQGNYKAAIGLLKNNPMPTFISVMDSRDEDPDQQLSRALYLDAMHKINDESDLKGALLEMQQIRAGTQEFNQAQKMLLENFEPSNTTLTGGLVKNEATAGTSK
jgi:hypothetical protein